MTDLNDLDLLHFKYMILGTKVLDKDEIKNIDDYKIILDLITKKFNEEVSKNLGNEVLYNLKCYNLIHRNGTCPTRYETDKFISSLTDEPIFLVRLFENLNTEDAFYILETYFNITQNQYLDLELDLESIDFKNSLQSVLGWLSDKNEEFSYIIANFLKNNFWKIDRNFPKSKYKGICLVISNREVVGYEPREETEVDERNIKETFSNQGFSVRIKRNVLFAGMKKVINEIKSEITESDKLIAIFLMSYGEDNVIITSDGNEFSFESLCEEFNNEHCPKLIDKPKLIFIVSCQEQRLNVAVKDYCIETDSIIKTKRYCPKISDFFYGYATYKNLESYRSPTGGTLYIDSLCKAINSSETGSIHNIHAEVNRVVKKTMNRGCYQTSFYDSMLGPENSFIFDPKID